MYTVPPNRPLPPGSLLHTGAQKQAWPQRQASDKSDEAAALSFTNNLLSFCKPFHFHLHAQLDFCTRSLIIVKNGFAGIFVNGMSNVQFFTLALTVDDFHVHLLIFHEIFH
jgi:hypothetical protein